MNSPCTDVGYISVNKYGEQLCGDHVEIAEGENNSTVMVLADGLGSGVKASILSTLTSKIIATMIANHMSIEDCVTTVASTLPVCDVRKIAYSTFTIIHIINNKTAEIIQYDNPHVILLRNGMNCEYDMTAREVDNKKIFQSKIELLPGDILMAMSDGAVYAGVGKAFNFGWQRKNIIDFLEVVYDKTYSPKTLATILLEQCVKLYGGNPGDDVTVAAVKIRKREYINLLIGPPSDPNELDTMMSLFFNSTGKHIICGGTTSTLAADYLGKELKTNLDYPSSDIPPLAELEGVDLVSEGVITINRVLGYAKSYLEDNACYIQWCYHQDAASIIAKLLFETATDINFIVGRAINPAHQNPNLPISFSIKMRLIEELSECLDKMGKRIKVKYF